MSKRVNGWIIAIDDDDMFTDSKAIETLVKCAKNKDMLLLWRVGFPNGRVVPSDENWHKKKIDCKDISGIGLMYHSKHVNTADWGFYKRGDYRVAKALSEKLTVKWINKVFTRLQCGIC